MPHGIAVTIERMKQRKNAEIMDIDATIVCERDSHKGIIIGKKAACLRKSVQMPDMKLSSSWK